jgi:putative flippase GtrA
VAAGSPSTPLSAQFLRYAGAGAVGTAAHYLVLVVLVQGAGIGVVAASTAGAIVGAAINYVLNYRYTFASRQPHARALYRFALVALAGILLNAVVVAAMLALAGPHYLVAQLVATGVVLLFGYGVNRLWTF